MISFFDPYAGWGMVVLRGVLGLIFIVHGWPKTTNPSTIAQAVWGGAVALGFLHGLVEVLGGLALILGFWLQPVAGVLTLIMLGALYFRIVKWKSPLVGGWEFDLVVLGGLLTVLLG